MSIEWAESAHRDLASILTCFSEIREKNVGQNLVDRLFSAVELLDRFPNSGRPGLVEGTKKLVVPDQSYVVVYKVTDHVEIVRVLHARRMRP